MYFNVHIKAGAGQTLSNTFFAINSNHLHETWKLIGATSQPDHRGEWKPAHLDCSCFLVLPLHTNGLGFNTQQFYILWPSCQYKGTTKPKNISEKQMLILQQIRTAIRLARVLERLSINKGIVPLKLTLHRLKKLTHDTTVFVDS